MFDRTASPLTASLLLDIPDFPFNVRFNVRPVLHLRISHQVEPPFSRLIGVSSRPVAVHRPTDGIVQNNSDNLLTIAAESH
jgi:hypothetical protein